MLERRQYVQYRDGKKHIAQDVVRRAQQVEGCFVLADEIRPGEQPEPADGVILGGRHHPAGHRHGEQQHIERDVSGPRQHPFQRASCRAAAREADS